MDFSRNSPGLWIGLAAVSLVVILCVCGMVSIAALAAYRLSQPEISAASPVTDPSGAAIGAATPTRPVLNIPTLPRASETWPVEDVPMPADADLGTLIGNAASFSVIADQDFKEVLDFYQGELVARGWSKVDYGTRITEADAELHYRKGDTNLIVTLARIPFVGTLVQIQVPPV